MHLTWKTTTYLLHDVLCEHGHLLRAWYPGSLGEIASQTGEQFN